MAADQTASDRVADSRFISPVRTGTCQAGAGTPERAYRLLMRPPRAQEQDDATDQASGRLGTSHLGMGVEDRRSVLQEGSRMSRRPETAEATFGSAGALVFHYLGR